MFRQVTPSETGEWDTRSEIGESGTDAATVTLTEPSRSDCGDGRRCASGQRNGADAATRPTVGAGGSHARSAGGSTAADAGGVSVLSLSQEHNSETNLYQQVDTLFPDGGYRRSVLIADECDFVECGDVSKCLLCAAGILQKKVCRPEIEPLSDEEKRKRSANRSAREISDIIRASELDHLLTPTAGKAFSTRKQALDAWSGYLDDARYGRWFGQVIDHRYLSIAEPYSDQAGWHLHIAFSGYVRPPHLMRLKVTWTAYLYHRLGIARPETEKGLWRVHIAPPGQGRSARALGRYLGKYLSKGFADSSIGERRFRSGLGLQRPIRNRTHLLLTDLQARTLFIDCGRYFEVTTADGRHLGWCGECEPRKHSPPVP